MRASIVLLILAFATAAFAVGGGGGGGGGGSGGSSGGSGSACAGVCDLVCLPSGAVQFRSTNTGQNVTARRLPDGQPFSVTGWWADTKFESDEAIFNDTGSYEVNGQSVQCPGLGFSCKLAAVSVESCTPSDGGIEAVYTGSIPDDQIKVNFKTADGKILFYEKALRSGGLNVSFSVEGGRTKIAARYQTPLEKIEISDKRCTGRYIVAGSADCTSASAPAKKFLCADFLSMFDRVKCRLSLAPSEQESALELKYLPEQCFPLKDAEQDTCVQGYQKLRQCQVYDASGERIACAKQTIGLAGNLNQYCSNRNDKAACKAEFSQNTYRLIIFRFYELEEKAEEWLADGRISLQDAADFVTLVEAAKIKFSEVQSYEEKRNVILGVRDIWKELVRVVK